MLNGFALAQPLLDILSKNPDFFAIRGSTSTQIVLFALFLVFVPPLALLAIEVLVAAFEPPRGRASLHLVFVAGLVAVVVAARAHQRLEPDGRGRRSSSPRRPGSAAPCSMRAPPSPARS